MDRQRFYTYQCKCIKAMREIISEEAGYQKMYEAAFPAYTDMNSLVRFLFWRRIWVTVNHLMSKGPFETVLDFGCGSGLLLPLMAQFSDRVVGLDIDVTPSRAFSKHLPFPETVEVFSTDKHPLSSYPDNSFDVIIAMDVLEHIDNLDSVLNSFCRFLKPGGFVIVSGPTENFFYRIGRIMAGKEYTGSYHVSNINNVRKDMNKFMKTDTLATLYYPFPLFKIICGTPQPTPGNS